jgi:hypothetical protein
MSRYRDSGSSDCKLYVGDLGKIVNNHAIFIVFFYYAYSKCIKCNVAGHGSLGRPGAGALVGRCWIKNVVDGNLFQTCCEYRMKEIPLRTSSVTFDVRLTLW